MAVSLLIAGSVSAAPAVWTESPLLKVGPSAQAKSSTSAQLVAARNEFESFQIVIRGDSEVSGVRAKASPLTGTGGATIPASNVRLYRQALMNVTIPSGAVGARGRYPDGLIPDVDESDGQTRSAFPFNVPAGEARALWVDILVPMEAPAGRYSGSIQVTGNGLDVTVPVELEVLGFTLPSTPTLSTAFRAWPGKICYQHTGMPDCGGHDAAIALLLKYARLGLDHRITFSNVFVLPHSMTSETMLGKHGDDWSEFDTTFGKLLDGTGATRLPGARLTSVEYAWKLTPEALAAYSQHAREKGFFDRVFDYTADEPSYTGTWGKIASRAALVRSAAPGMRTLVTSNITETHERNLVDSLDIIVPIVNHMDAPKAPYLGNQRPHYEDFIQKGGEVWLYQSCMSHGCSFGGGANSEIWPSYMIDVPAPRNRAMQWVNFAYGVTGELYYETVMTFAEDPWASQFSFSGNGDGTLLYPGKPSKIGGTSQVPVPSLRLKHIRDGVEDYEYLTLLVKLGDSALAQKLARDVVPTAHSISDDPNVILEARRAAGRRIAQLSTKPEPAPTPPPSLPETPPPST
ncbi:MAG TPA: glycoside hydrolase domain-containing protein, partial [Hyalangium sp.]|nr:glycoside hydrolase domain-containing protein [Hyalangium sp.]